ncbi:hypothetical protein [Sulfurimonas microaerophilic]|uniref:hypothetical protein n=1 Tax=Sulfurimonas microaerophilic TaxID=3058392 RepID=UPI002714D59C|nr:hypothetical protein [Sulfurimonas sp. hsl 1-7]
MSNASKYQQSQKEISIELIKDAIKHIQGLGGIVNQSSVSRVTFDLADVSKKQKGLTPSAISKNEIYRGLVDEASHYKNINTHTTLKDYSEADIRIQLASLRVKYSLLKDENKILKDKQQDYQEQEFMEQKTILQGINIDEEGHLFKHALKDIVNTLLLENITYIDSNTSSLKLSIYDTLLLDGMILHKLGIVKDTL